MLGGEDYLEPQHDYGSPSLRSQWICGTWCADGRFRSESLLRRTLGWVPNASSSILDADLFSVFHSKRQKHGATAV